MRTVVEDFSAARAGLGLFAALFAMSTSLPATQESVAAVAELPAIQEAVKVFSREANWIMQQQVRVTTIPAPPFQEEQRAFYLAEQFKALGLEDVNIDDTGNVLGTWPGADPERVILLSAHIDTVFPPGTNVEVRQEGKRWFGPGIADNATGVAALLALIRAIEEAGLRTRADILFVGNVGEEGEGNLRGMQALFADPELRQRVRAAVIVDGSSAERLTTKALGSKRFEIIVTGPGGHSWADYGLPNPIQALSRMVHRLSALELSVRPRTILNVGEIDGGTSVNSIPARAVMKIDIRSEAEEEIDRLEEALRKAVHEAMAEENAWARKKSSPLQVEIVMIGRRPAGEIASSARVVKVFRSVDDHLGIQTLVQRSSTDANIPISLGVEAVAVGGGGRSAASHSLQEWFDPEGRELALKRILLAVALLAGIETGEEE